MNRNERRRLKREIEKPDPVYNVKGSQLDAIAGKHARRATSEAFAYMVGIVVEVMHEEFGWDEQGCEWIVDKLLEKYDSTHDLEKLTKNTQKLSGMKLVIDK